MLAFIASNGKLVRKEKPLPRLHPKWARVKVRLAGICNTDMEILRGYHSFRGTPGHEFVGEVAEVIGVSTSKRQNWLGRRVTGEINIHCTALGFRPVCRFCNRGLKTHCTRRTVVGILGHDGAFAEYLSLPLENLHLVPDSVSDEQAVFVEPLAAACEILSQIDIQKSKSAAVLGDGKLAQLIARVLRTKLSRVVVYGKYKGKLALARAAKIGTEMVHGDERDHAKLRDSYDLLVEATGSPTGLRLAQEMTEPRGILVLKSTFHGTAPVETWPIVVKELNIIGSRCGPFDAAIGLLCSGKVDPTPLITKTFPLANADHAIQFAQKSGVMKILLRA